MTLLIGTADGLISDGLRLLAGHRIDDLAVDAEEWLVLSDGSTVWSLPSEKQLASVTDSRLNCLLADDDGALLGADAARLFRLGADGSVSPDAAFDEAPGRSDWYTPWGGPADVRSLARDVDGTVYLNVHVGGILRFRSDDPVWRDTMDIHADVHEVIAHPDRAGVSLAATARGLAISHDGADTWTFHTDGLHARYCRAVAVSGDTVFVSASRSNRGEQAAVYRTDLDGTRLQRCEEGLPEWFTTNIDTGCLAVRGDEVVIGDAAGSVFRSTDGGQTWAVATEVSDVRCVALADS